MLKSIKFSNTSYSTTYGKVISIKGPLVIAKLPDVKIGDYCKIFLDKEKFIGSKVVSFNEFSVSLAPFSNLNGISPNALVENTHESLLINCSENLIGKVCDPLGNILSNKVKLVKSEMKLSIYNKPPNPLQRKKINESIQTGISAIDIFCPIGFGQRIGLFASAGVGKSTLLGMIAKNSTADINIIALVGERGREVNEFINENLGKNGMQKSIVIFATSDEPALTRQVAAYTATTIAEYFRDKGKKVLLLVDSLTRTARAIREVSLANGELPVRQGYPASVFSELPLLLERAGTSSKGSITAIYTILKNAENESDPLAEEITSILDGHITLNKNLVNQGIRPAIDITNSLSRLENQLLSYKEIENVNKIRKIISKLENEKELLIFGGTPDKELEIALNLEDDINNLRIQNINDNRKAEYNNGILKNLINNLTI